MDGVQPARMVKLESSDNKVFAVDMDVALMSHTVKSILEGRYGRACLPFGRCDLTLLPSQTLGTRTMRPSRYPT